MNLIGGLYEYLGAWVGEGVGSQGNEVEENVIIRRDIGPGCGRMSSSRIGIGGTRSV